jgi:intergrase/recombinase
MACGTPVIAYRSGSVPEVIDDGITGFIVENEEEAIRAVKEVTRLDRRRVRIQFEERFSAVRMARDYEKQYRKLVSVASIDGVDAHSGAAKLGEPLRADAGEAAEVSRPGEAIGQ